MIDAEKEFVNSLVSGIADAIDELIMMAKKWI